MPNSIITVQGQAWDQVARVHVGAENQMGVLLADNVEEADALLFSGNTAVTVPGRSVTRARSMPPWERM